MALLRRAHEVDPALPVIMITAFATHRVRGGGHQGGRLRLPAQELLRGSAPRGGGARATAPTACRWRTATCARSSSDARARQHHRPQPGHGPGVRAGQEGGALGGQHPGPRRVRDRQGADRPRRSTPTARAPRQRLRAGRLRLAARATSSNRSYSATRRARSPGPMRTKPGLMEVADRGTLFLDEIGGAAVDPSGQAVCARCRSGRSGAWAAPSLIDVDVRVVSATNRDLREAVAKGQFREELYYRVNVIEIRLPPLRERAGDVSCWPTPSSSATARDGSLGYEDDGDGGARGLRLARQRARAAERRRARVRAGRGRDHHAPRPAGHMCWSLRRRAPGPVPSGRRPSGPDAGRRTSPLKDAKERWMEVLEGIVPPGSARASRRQHLRGRQGGGHRPQDVPPPGQQIPDSFLTFPAPRPVACSGRASPTEERLSHSRRFSTQQTPCFTVLGAGTRVAHRQRSGKTSKPREATPWRSRRSWFRWTVRSSPSTRSGRPRSSRPAARL